MLNLPPPESVAINQQVAELLARGVNVCSLASGELKIDLPQFSLGSQSDFIRGSRYSDSRGLQELRDLVSAEYECRPKSDEQIVISSGSKLLLYMILLSLCDRGDEVVVLEPAWLSYRSLVSLVGAKVVSVPYTEGAVDLSAHINKRTKAIVINNPNNPAGRLYSRDEMAQSLELVREKGITLICDEAYSSFDEGFVSIAELDPHFKHSILLNSFSKNFALSGWRLGYAISNSERTLKVLRLNQHLLTCASTVLQIALAKHFFEIKSLVAPKLHALSLVRREIAEYAKEVGFEVMPGSTTFYLMLSPSPTLQGSEQFAHRLLDEKHIAVVPGSAYGQSCDRFVRISVGMESPLRIKASLTKIREFFDHSF